MVKAENDYDTETRHAQDQEMQELWLSHIDSMLGALSDCSIPRGKVRW